MLNYSSSDYITDALGFGFELAPLTIHNIPYKDKFQERKIYLGLKNIKGLPRDFAFWIIEERQKNPFSSVEDFILRLPQSYHKLPLLSPLVQLGLFDVFEPNRQKILHNLPNLFVFADELGSLFADTSYSWTDSEDFTAAEKFEQEQALIGIGLSDHPLISLAKKANRSFVWIEELADNSKATILVEVQSIKVIRTKNGENMAFMQVTDTKKKLDVTLFPEVYRRFAKQIQEKGYYYLTGKIQERDGRLQMVLAEVEKASSERFWIQLADTSHDRQIAEILQRYPGDIPVVLRYENDKKTVPASGFQVQKSDQLQAELENYSMKTVFR